MPPSVPHPSGTGAVHEARQDIGGFKKFLLRGNVVDLAVGIVIGASFGNVVQSLVKDFITPLIGMLGGQPNFSNYAITVGRTRFLVGDFVNALISFLLIALVVYIFVVLPINKLIDKYRPQPQPAPTKDCPECTSKIPEAARRCPQCSAQLAPPSAEVAEAMRQAGAPSGATIADEAAKVLTDRLQGRNGAGGAG